MPDPPPRSVVGTGLSKELGIRTYEGNGDNEGTTQERIDRCAAACFFKKTALEYGPWSSRTDAIGFGVIESTGRCHCEHVEYAEFIELAGFGGCLDGKGTESGWLGVNRPYTPATCANACSGYNFFTIVTLGDRNCKCADFCLDAAYSPANAYKISLFVQPTFAPTVSPTALALPGSGPQSATPPDLS